MDFKTVITYLKDLFATVMILLAMFSPVFGGNGAEYEAKNPDELVTSFVVASDIHVETNQPKSYQNLNDVLDGIKAGKNIKSVVYTGDNVMNGQLLEDFFFYSAIRAKMPAENNLVVAGNHDLGNGEGDLPQLLKNYIAINKLVLGNDVGKGYYYQVIDGCYMIVLISEDPTSEDFMMGTEQYNWIEGVLKEANEADAPVIVFNHFPLRYLDNGSEIHYSQLSKLFIDYGVELYIHGHIHNHMGTDNFYIDNGVNAINLPRITETKEYDAGDGIVVEVYENEILVRARDFISGEWIEGLEYTYPIG